MTTPSISECTAPNRPWTDKDDDRLIAWGCGFNDGHAFVAAHDLGRTAQEGRDRIAWLRANKPDMVRRIEAEAAA